VKEMFASGTAAVISPIGELCYNNEGIRVADGNTGPLTLKLYNELTAIQYGHKKDPYDWVVRLG